MMTCIIRIHLLPASEADVNSDGNERRIKALSSI